MTKRPFKEAETTKTAKVKGSALDAEIHIILLENVQSHQETRTKEHSLEVLGVIAICPWSRHASPCKIGSRIVDALSTCGPSKASSQLQAYKWRVLFFNLGQNLSLVTSLAKDGKVIELPTLWHRRLGHANMHLIQSLASKELVRNLPKLRFDQHFCDACKIDKQAHVSHKAKNIVSMTRCLELLHMDLFGPSTVRSYGGNRYTLVIVDDYSRYTWTRFLKNKTEAFDQFEIFSKKIQNQLGCTIVSIRTDRGREFDNEVQFGEFCNANGITHNFSALRTP
ncbi:retrovirus-related pol polyprotein from transposon TNT 1-94 [Tanacetum coccineum]